MKEIWRTDQTEKNSEKCENNISEFWKIVDMFAEWLEPILWFSNVFPTFQKTVWFKKWSIMFFCIDYALVMTLMVQWWWEIHASKTSYFIFASQQSNSDGLFPKTSIFVSHVSFVIKNIVHDLSIYMYLTVEHSRVVQSIYIIFIFVLQKTFFTTHRDHSSPVFWNDQQLNW